MADEQKKQHQQKRLAQQLRANLRRRKEQSRQRACDNAIASNLTDQAQPAENNFL